MPSKRALNESASSGKVAKVQRTTRTHHDGGATEGSLCSQCAKLDIMTMFSKETNSKDFGSLERFMDTTCPFCTIVWDCVRLHWGSSSPLNNGVRPHLYIQSKKWGSCKTLEELHGEQDIHRILLALTGQPPNFRLNRRKTLTDKQNRFIIGELELRDQRMLSRSSIPKLRCEVGSFLDIDRLRRWLQDCQELKHNFTRDSDLFHNGFRLIDVQEARLVEVTEPCEYVALSYVWGPHDPLGLRTTKRNLTRLKGPGALAPGTNTIDRRIPCTIRDAMKLCTVIGYRYLWIDCLCIVQDDKVEKERLIHGMNNVYENASLTVIAASGQDADAGLPGITARGKVNHEKGYAIQISEALLLISVAPISLEEQVRKSHWNTRAWTLQEQSLSKRRLYFTPDEVFFDCECGVRRESYVIEDFKSYRVRSGSPFWGRSRNQAVEVPLLPLLPREGNGDWDYSMYADVVSNYSRRNLSYPEDVFSAFSGIYHRCINAQQSQPSMVAVQGLNSTSFTRSLLWFIAKHDKTKIKQREVAHGIRLASWSWASWEAPVDFVSIVESSFPAPYGENFHFPDEDSFAFVSTWHLAFKDGDGIDRVTVPGNVLPFSDKYWRKLPELLVPDHILAMMSNKRPIHELNDEAGCLTFVAPCITLSNYQLTVDERVPDGGHLLFLPGLQKYFSIIVFDSNEYRFTDLVLILFDNCFVALCVKTEGQTSQRIGVAQMEQKKLPWQRAIDAGNLTLQWKQLYLI